jgi:hypothetical protein
MVLFETVFDFFFVNFIDLSVLVLLLFSADYKILRKIGNKIAETEFRAAFHFSVTSPKPL